MGTITPSTPTHPSATKFAPDADKAAAVADVFSTAWAGYHDHAFPNDTLHPVSNTGENDR